VRNLAGSACQEEVPDSAKQCVFVRLFSGVLDQMREKD